MGECEVLVWGDNSSISVICERQPDLFTARKVREEFASARIRSMVSNDSPNHPSRLYAEWPEIADFSGPR